MNRGRLRTTIFIFAAVSLVSALFAISPALVLAGAVSPLVIFGISSGFKSWKRGVELLGLGEALKVGWRFARIRHRQTLRAMMLTAPAFTVLPAVIGVTYLCLGWNGSLADPSLYLNAVNIAISLSLLLMGTSPPVSLFLGSSQYGGFLAMKHIHVQGCPIVSLVDQASRNVLQQYDRHYGAIIESMPPVSRGIAKTAAPFVDPRAPRFDSIRTRTSQWQRTVLELMDHLPILVLDARDSGRQIQREALWALAPGRRHKVLFLADDENSRPPLMSRLAALGLTLDGRNLRIFTEQHACETIRAMIQSGDLARQSAGFAEAPPIDADTDLERAQEKLTEMESIYNDLLARARSGSGPDRALDADLARLRPAAGGDAPPFTSSLDAALDLARSLLKVRAGEQHSYRIDIMTDDTGYVSIGVQDRPGNLRVFESDASDRVSPPRSVLIALLLALRA
jgi:hypothetical protein